MVSRTFRAWELRLKIKILRAKACLQSHMAKTEMEGKFVVVKLAETLLEERQKINLCWSTNTNRQKKQTRFCNRVMRKLILHKQSHKRQVYFDKVVTTHWHYPILFPSTTNKRWSANFFSGIFRTVGATINTTKHHYKSLLGCVLSRKSLCAPIPTDITNSHICDTTIHFCYLFSRSSSSKISNPQVLSFRKDSGETQPILVWFSVWLSVTSMETFKWLKDIL